MHIRIATYNIHKGVLGVRRPKLTIHELRPRLHDLNADLVFLQEVQGRHDKHESRFEHWPSVAQHEFLALGEVEALLGHASQRYFSAYGMNAIYPHGHHGNALLSTHPIDWRMNEDVSDHRLEQRGLLHCRVQSPVGAIHCIVAHFGLFGGSRRRQTYRLLEHVRRFVPRNAPLIVAGDLNDWSRSLGKPITRGLELTEVLPTTGLRKVTGFASFPAGRPLLGLDRVFVRGFQIRQAKVESGPAWAKLSDHAPLVVDLELCL